MVSVSKKYRPAPAEWLPKFDRKVLDDLVFANLMEYTGKRYENPDFEVKIVQDVHNYFATDLFAQLRIANAQGRRLSIILPSPENAVFISTAAALNKYRVSAKNLSVYFLYEYANEKGEVAPPESRYSRSGHFMRYFYQKLDPELRPDLANIHFFTRENAFAYSEMLEKAGGADVAYTALSWSGGIGAIDAESYRSDTFEEFLAKGSGIVKPMPEMIAHDSLRGMFGCSGDIGNVPPFAATVGPRDIAAAKTRFDVEYLCGCGGVPSHQKIPVRMALMAPVCPENPAAMLRTLPGCMVIAEPVIKAPLCCGDVDWLADKLAEIAEKEGK